MQVFLNIWLFVLIQGLFSVNIALGIWLVFKTADNYLRMLWGTFALFLESGLLLANIKNIVSFSSGEVMFNISWSAFDVGLMFQWLFVSLLLTIFPILSLRHNWFTWSRVAQLLIPLLFVGMIDLSFHFYHVTETPIASLSDVLQNLFHWDVLCRFLSFIVVLVVPCVYIVLPFFEKKRVYHRQFTLGAYIYIIFFFSSETLFLVMMFYNTPLLYLIYNLICTILPLCFSIIYLKNDNPLSLPITQKGFSEMEPTVKPVSLPVVEVIPADKDGHRYDAADFSLSVRLMRYMDTNCPYVNENFGLPELAKALAVSRPKVTEAIHQLGFTSFKEYITFLRIQQFKKLAHTSQQASVNELMLKCGYTSRATFYRQFSIFEQCTPKEYMDSIV